MDAYMKFSRKIDKMAIFEAMFLLIEPHESKLLFVTAVDSSA